MYAKSIITPDQNISVLDEQFQLVHAEILSKKSTPKTEDQVTPVQNEKSNGMTESENLDKDSSAAMSRQPTSVLSSQLVDIPIDENIPSTKRLTTDDTFTSEDHFSSLHQHVSTENEENKSSGSTSNPMMVRSIVFNFYPECEEFSITCTPVVIENKCEITTSTQSRGG